MKLREVIGTLCMIVLTVCGMVLSIGFTVKCVFSSDNMLRIMTQSEYLDKSEEEAKVVLKHYMSSEKVDEILQNISTKSLIRKITEAFGSNSVQQVANDAKLEFKQITYNSLDDNPSQDTKEKFATVVSDAYIKSIFPVTEFNVLSNIYSKINTKLNYILIISLIVVFGAYIYLANSKKMYKWAIIGLYNVIILNIIIVVTLGMFNGIVVGNTRITNVIYGMLKNIKFTLIVATIITLGVAVISNYLAYFKNKNKLSSKR